MAEWEKPTLQAPTEQSNLWSKRLEEFFKDRKHEEDGFSFTQKSELLSTSDRVKNYIQAFTSVPIIWWPFSDPRRQLKHGKTRMAWQCASCQMRLSVDLAAVVTEGLSHQLVHNHMATTAHSPAGDSHLDSSYLLLPGRDEKFDDEERDETMSKASTLVDTDAHSEASGPWRQKLNEYCITQGLPRPLYTTLSDRRGGRTAWSSTVNVAGEIFAAFYWYDGTYIQNAMEDAAQIALKSLSTQEKFAQQPTHNQDVTTPVMASNNGESVPGNLPASTEGEITTNFPGGSSFVSRRHQRTQRAYPPSSVDSLSKADVEVDEALKKWIHWCVDASKTRLHEICVEAPTGAKRGCEFIKELVGSYRKIRGIRWWLSLTDCAAVKVVKFVRLLDGRDLVKCGSETINLDEIRRTLEYDIDTENTFDEDLHMAWVESTLAHYILHHREFITDSSIEGIISGLPKKTKCCISKKAKSVGYGILSLHGLSLAKILCILVVSACLGLSFFIYWLIKHPGDIQNASVPYFMLMAAIGAFVALPDFYIS